VAAHKKTRQLGEADGSAWSTPNRFSNICNAPASWLKTARKGDFTPFGSPAEAKRHMEEIAS
jgi:hypothetical protein